MNIRFFLDSKDLPDGRRYILAALHYNSLKPTVSTTEKVLPDTWDQPKQRVKKSYAGAAEINLWLDKVKANLSDIYRTLRLEQTIPDPAEIKVRYREWLDPGRSDKHGFFDRYQQYIDLVDAKLTPGTMTTIKSTRDHLEKYEQLRRISLTYNKMNRFFFQDFVNYLLVEADLIDNSVHGHIVRLKTFLRESADYGWCKPINTRPWKVKTHDADVVALEWSEVEALIKIDLSGEPYLERSRDALLLMIFTGLRFSDVQHAVNLHLQPDDTFQIATRKTRVTVRIPLLKYARPLLEKYPGGIPLLRNQGVNKCLKKIAQRCGITELITVVQYQGGKRLEQREPKWKLVSTKLGRRTFVSQSLRLGVAPEVIMQITGHKTLDAFWRYVKVADSRVLDEFSRAWASVAGNEPASPPL